MLLRVIYLDGMSSSQCNCLQQSNAIPLLLLCLNVFQAEEHAAGRDGVGISTNGQ